MRSSEQETSLRNIAIILVSSFIMSLGTAYVSTKVTIASQKSDIHYIKGDLVKIANVLEKVNLNGTELARYQEWRAATEYRLQTMERNQTVLLDGLKDRYTRTEARKDYTAIIDALTHKLDKIDEQ